MRPHAAVEHHPLFFSPGFRMRTTAARIDIMLSVVVVGFQLALAAVARAPDSP